MTCAVQLEYQPVRQLLTEARDYNDWFSKTNDTESEQFIDHIHLSEISNKLKNHIGYLQFSHANAVNSVELLKAYKTFSPGKAIRYELFDFNELIIEQTCVTYKNQQFDQLIFCDGYRANANPFWSWLPFQPVKGEIIDIYAPNLQLDFILNSLLYIIPQGADKYKVGATYNWKDKTDLPTAEGKAELIERIKEIINCDFEIIEHFAGVRPTVKDRRPLVGTHSEYNRLHILNGLGTRGVMLGPAMAKSLFDQIEHQIPLDKEIDIQRFRNKTKK